MNEKALKKLEYDKIIKKLAYFAASPMAKQKAEKLRPYTAMMDITAAQQETSEAVSMVLRKGTLALGGLKEIRPQIKRAYMGGTLSMEELMNIGSFLYVCRRAKDYAKNDKFIDIVTRMREECEVDARKKFELQAIPSQLAGLWMGRYGYTTKQDTNVSAAQSDEKTKLDRIIDQICGDDADGQQ